jgi:hypothetical protein
VEQTARPQEQVRFRCEDCGASSATLGPDGSDAALRAFLHLHEHCRRAVVIDLTRPTAD